MNKIKTIIDKEWAEVFKNRLVLFSVLFLPLILVALPFVTLGTMGSFDEAAVVASGSGDLPTEMFGTICTGMTDYQCLQTYLLSIYVLLYMIVPIMIPATIAAYSIVGEKSTRSLEPLLATPITTLELLLGKALAAVIPAVIATYLGFLVFLAGAWLLTDTAVMQAVLGPFNLFGVLLVGPLLALFAVSASILISSRVSDPRTAEQITGVMVLPIVLVIVGQSVGLVLITGQIILFFAAAMVVVDALLFYVTVRYFERETILTRWK